MKYYVGIDVGTSGCRVVAFDEELRQVAGASRSYPTLTPRPGWAEQDPEAVVEAAAGAIAALLAEPVLRGQRPAAVGLATAMHALIALDAAGRPVTNALIWADLRAAEEAERLKAEFGAAELYRRTGCPAHPMYLPAKILWLKSRAGELFARTARLVSLKDYLLYRLAGRFLVDRSSASATGLFSLATLDWDEAVLKAAGIEAGLLSEAVSPLTQVEGFTTDLARRHGLPPGIPLVLGATDGTLSSLGSGAVLPGQMTAMIGTSGAVRVVSAAPVLDREGRTWCYYLLPERWVPGGAINNGGNILQWYRDRFGAADVQEALERGVDPYKVLSERAATVPPGSRGLVFLPFLAGERSPRWNSRARGVLFGLNLGHGPSEVVRSLMEGVVFQLYSVYEALVENVGTPREVRASGGFTKSREWLQIMADVFGAPLVVPRVEGTAFGAAALAMLATGRLPALEDVSRHIPMERIVEPEPARTEVYRELYGLYQCVYRKLGPEFAGIARYQAREGEPR